MRLSGLLEDIQQGIHRKALEFRNRNIHEAKNMEELASIIESRMGFVKAPWCEAAECETEIKAKTGATTRCIPFEQENVAGDCIVCGKQSKRFAYFAKAY